MRGWSVAELAERMRAGTHRWAIDNEPKENQMTEMNVPPVPVGPNSEPLAPTPPTLIQTLNAKLKAAQAARAAADQVVKDLEDEIKALPKHLHDLTFADMMGKVDGWFK